MAGDCFAAARNDRLSSDSVTTLGRPPAGPAAAQSFTRSSPSRRSRPIDRTRNVCYRAPSTSVLVPPQARQPHTRRLTSCAAASSPAAPPASHVVRATPPLHPSPPAHAARTGTSRIMFHASRGTEPAMPKHMTPRALAAHHAHRGFTKRTHPARRPAGAGSPRPGRRPRPTLAANHAHRGFTKRTHPAAPPVGAVREPPPVPTPCTASPPAPRARHSRR